jgi:hypothetical protein
VVQDSLTLVADSFMVYYYALSISRLYIVSHIIILSCNLMNQTDTAAKLTCINEAPALVLGRVTIDSVAYDSPLCFQIKANVVI